ncbi:MAG: hypothetical protein Q8K75_04845 [Chlamydiales bacterium]|nr:hypothetical protein [Chlamydiales bacterium]
MTSTCLSFVLPAANRFSDWMLAKDCIQLSKWQRSVRWIRQTVGQTVQDPPLSYERKRAIALRGAAVTIPLQISAVYLAIKAWGFVDLSNSNKPFSKWFPVLHEGTGCIGSDFAPIPFTTLYYVKYQIWMDQPCPGTSTSWW